MYIRTLLIIYIIIVFTDTTTMSLISIKIRINIKEHKKRLFVENERILLHIETET